MQTLAQTLSHIFFFRVHLDEIVQVLEALGSQQYIRSRRTEVTFKLNVHRPLLGCTGSTHTLGGENEYLIGQQDLTNVQDHK